MSNNSDNQEVLSGFMLEAHKILGLHLWTPTNPSKICAETRNVDMVMQEHNGNKIFAPIRIRRFKYIEFSKDFTIRTRPKYPPGRLEMAKILEGCGKYIFYGFSDAKDKHLEKWFIGDLDVFRLWFISECKQRIAYNDGMFDNRDFIAFKVSTLPDDFIIAERGYFVKDNQMELAIV